MTLRAELVGRWRDLIAGHDEICADLLGRYADPTRHYHGLTHLADVLAHIDTLAAADPATVDLRAVQLAAWFHDAVYDVHADDNEERSARLAETTLTAAAVEPSVVAEVARLVRLTAVHAPTDDDASGQVLCDADLAILASGSDRYESYRQAVRAEYAWVPDEAFRRGRAIVLRRLLDLTRLFGTAYGQQHWEGPARANLVREVAELED